MEHGCEYQRHAAAGHHGSNARQGLSAVLFLSQFCASCCHASDKIAIGTRPGFAAFLELCCAPLYILAKVQLADGVVAVAEAAAIIAKGSLTLYLLKGGSLPVPIALSWAQVSEPHQHALVRAHAWYAVACCVVDLPHWPYQSLHLQHIFILYACSFVYE